MLLVFLRQKTAEPLPRSSVNLHFLLIFRQFWATCVPDLFACFHMHPYLFGGTRGGIELQNWGH